MKLRLYQICRIFIILMAIIFLCCIISAIDIVVEKKQIDSKIDDFIQRGEYLYTIDNNNYYVVEKKYEYENSEQVFNIQYPNNVGTIGDIYITDRNPLKGNPITKIVSKFAFIGHCGMVYDYNASSTIEIIGNYGFYENKVSVIDNTWTKESDTPRLLGLRVKGINEEKKEKLIVEANKALKKGYNYLFLMESKETYYCTDLITRLYETIDYKLNKDYFYTSGSDIISNDNTYLIYYKEEIVQDNKLYHNIYFLGEKND